jgi:hypothetical protein
LQVVPLGDPPRRRAEAPEAIAQVIDEPEVGLAPRAVEPRAGRLLELGVVPVVRAPLAQPAPALVLREVARDRVDPGARVGARPRSGGRTASSIRRSSTG